MKRGAEVERDFRASLNHIDCWARKMIPDMSGAPFDYLVLTDESRIAAEIKCTDDFRLPYSIIRDTQRVGLTAFERIAGNASYVVCQYRRKQDNGRYDKRMFLIPWNAVRDEVCSGRRGSIDLSAYRELPRIDARSWDFSCWK